MQYKNKKIQHETDFGQINHLSISGYSIEPDRSIDHVINFLNGLCQYPQEWYCDHNINNDQMQLDLHIKEIPGGPSKSPHKVFSNTIVHNGFIDNVIYGPVAVFYNKEKSSYQSSLGDEYIKDAITEYAFVIFEGGYCMLSFEKLTPTKITLDISSFKNIDIDLVSDHMRAPSIKGDGFGAFDLFYNLSKRPVINNALSFVLQNRNSNDNNNFDLESITCLYCDDKAVKWDISASKSITVCSKHFENKKSPYKEIKYYGGDSYRQ